MITFFFFFQLFTSSYLFHNVICISPGDKFHLKEQRSLSVHRKPLFICNYILGCISLYNFWDISAMSIVTSPHHWSHKWIQSHPQRSELMFYISLIIPIFKNPLSWILNVPKCSWDEDFLPDSTICLSQVDYKDFYLLQLQHSKVYIPSTL